MIAPWILRLQTFNIECLYLTPYPGFGRDPGSNYCGGIWAESSAMSGSVRAGEKWRIRGMTSAVSQ